MTGALLSTTVVHQEEGAKFVFREMKMEVPDNYMDRWILSFTQSLVKFVTKEMAGECSSAAWAGASQGGQGQAGLHDNVPADLPPRWQKVSQSRATRPRCADVSESDWVTEMFCRATHLLGQ